MHGPRQDLRAFGVLQGEFKQIVQVGFSISYAYYDGIRTVFLCPSPLLKALEPFVTFFLFNGRCCSASSLPKLLGVSGPTLDIEQPQRSPFQAKRHGIVNNQPYGAVLRTANRTDVVGGGMSRVIERGGVLNGKNCRIFGNSLYGLLVMQLEDLFHSHFAVFQKPIRCFGLSPILASLRDIGLRTSIHILSQAYKSLGQPKIAEIRIPEFISGPASTGRRGNSCP